jgi:hypothetical protein
MQTAQTGGAGRARSLLHQSPAMVAVAVAIADSIRFADPDLWGHIRFGEAMLQAHRLILRDPYSYSAAGHPWLNHEWLAEIALACAYQALGVLGLKLLKLAMTAVTVTALAAAIGESDAPEGVQLGVLLVTALAIAPWVQFRPQLFTFAAFAALLLILARDSYGSGRRMWIAIPLLALWANLHGGFIVGVGALWTYALATGAADAASGRGAIRLLHLCALAIAATLATLATPYGIGTWRAVLNALSNPYTRAVIADWQPLLHNVAREWPAAKLRAVYDVAPLALGAALAGAWLLTLRDDRNAARDDAGLIAIAAVMIAAALVSVRNAPLAEIAVALPLPRYAGLALASRGRRPERTARFSAPAGQAIFGALAIALLAGTGLFSNRLGARERYPSGAVAFMRSHDLRGNVLDYFLWGEYLIWHLEPGSKVFIDGRYDTVYPRRVLRDYIRFHLGESGQVLDSYPDDFVLIAPKTGAQRLMESRRDWRLIYRDRISLLYARSDSPAAKIAGAPVIGSAPPTRFP